MATNTGTREDQYSVTVNVEGDDFGVWDKMGGGEIDSDETKYRPGAMAPQISLGGFVEVSNVTVERMYDLDRDHKKVGKLIAAVGKGKVTVAKQPLDRDGNAYGKPIVYTGILKQVTLPDVDSESSDAGMLEIEVAAHATVGT